MLAQDREPYLERARLCSELTLPYLIPPDDLPKGAKLKQPYQSVGASGVTNLASKLLLSMLPPNEPCFRLRIDNLEFEREQEQMDKNFKAQVDKALSRVEQAVIGDIETKGDRPVVYEGNQHLIIGGNVLYHDDEDKGLRLIPLSKFVTMRDPSGQVIEIIIKETVTLCSLPADFAEKLRKNNEEDSPDKKDSQKQYHLSADFRKDEQEEVELYTCVTLEDDDKWHVFQECRGHVIDGTDGTYKRYECPYIPVRMYQIAGENYGRSFVENYLGDLISLESLEQALLEASAISARMLFLVNPNSVTDTEQLVNAPNGGVVTGLATDVTVLQTQKQADLQVVQQEVMTLKDNLRTAFLMVDGIRRDAERVTAEEIRVMAQELEANLGGVYTVISQEFQLPYITGRMARLTDARKLPPLPQDEIKPTIVTGFEAIGRGNDKQKLLEFLTTLTETLGEHAFSLININNAVSRLASSMGINPEGLIKTEEEQMQERQQAMAQQQEMQQADMAKQVSPEIIKQLGNNLPSLISMSGGEADPAMLQQQQTTM